MTKTVEKYSDQDVALIEAAAAAGPLNFAVANELGKQMGKTGRQVTAKIVSMGLPYQRKVRASKNGEPIASKADVVARIADATGIADVRGLENAPKQVLLSLARKVEELAGE